MWLIEIVSTEGFTPSSSGQFGDKIFELRISPCAKHRVKRRKVESITYGGPIAHPRKRALVTDVNDNLRKIASVIPKAESAH